jgi:adenylate kinase
MSEKRKVVYLTGAPAAGKSTLIRTLASTRPDVKVFEYGRMMSEKLGRGKAPGQGISQHTLRGGTSGRVTQRDIDDLDTEMTDWIERYNSQCHLVIDSHQVTIEPFGFGQGRRITCSSTACRAHPPAVR